MNRIVALFIVFLLLVACVPTPDEEAVLNRTDGALEQAITEPPVTPYVYEAPARWEETYTVRKREIRFEADVEVPTAEQFPVETVKQYRIAGGDVVSFLEKLCPGDWDIRENELSREELTEDLKHAANMYLGEDDDTGEPVYGPNEEEMQRIQKQIEQAPLEDSYIPLSTVLQFPVTNTPVKNSSGETWYLSAQSKETRSSVRLARHRDSSVQTEQAVMQVGSAPYRPDGLKNVKISREDAIRVCEETLSALGFAGFRAADAEKAIEAQSYSLAELSEGYLVHAVFALEGTVPCCYAQASSQNFIQTGDDPDATFAPPWQQEFLELYVTEEGVQQIWWSQPKEHVLVANENVKLMPFEAFRQSFQKLIEFGTGDYADSPLIVKRLVLTTAIAQIPNQGDEAFLIPAWAIFLTTEDDQAAHIAPHVLLINAIDGSTIRVQ